MIVHLNPMFQERPGFWHDTKTTKIRVEPRLINRGNHRQRWIVIHKKGPVGEVVSYHITESAAVVAAQTLANRVWRVTDTYKRERAAKLKKGKRRG